MYFPELRLKKYKVNHPLVKRGITDNKVHVGECHIMWTE